MVERSLLPVNCVAYRLLRQPCCLVILVYLRLLPAPPCLQRQADPPQTIHMPRRTTLLFFFLLPQALLAQPSVDDLDKKERALLKQTKLEKVKTRNGGERFVYFLDQRSNQVFSVEETGLSQDRRSVPDSA